MSDGLGERIGTPKVKGWDIHQPLTRSRHVPFSVGDSLQATPWTSCCPCLLIRSLCLKPYPAETSLPWADLGPVRGLCLRSRCRNVTAHNLMDQFSLSLPGLSYSECRVSGAS